MSQILIFESWRSGSSTTLMFFTVVGLPLHPTQTRSGFSENGLYSNFDVSTMLGICQMFELNCSAYWRICVELTITTLLILMISFTLLKNLKCEDKPFGGLRYGTHNGSSSW